MSDNKPRGSAPILEVSQPTEAITTRKRISDKQLDTSFMGKLRYEMQFIRGRGAFEIGIVFLALLASFTIASLIAPDVFPFLSPANVSGVLTQSIPLMAILAIGVGILMIAGEFDLSLGFAISFNAIVFVRVTELYGPVAGIFAGLASGVFVGLVNGAIVVFTKIPSFIATLGMGFFWGGASIFINGSQAAQLPPELVAEGSWFEFVFAHDFGAFRSQLVWLIIIGIAAYFFLQRHRLGNHIYAVGGNAAAATAISINPTRVKLMAFGIEGLLVGFAAIIFVARISSVQPGGSATQDFTLFAVAAAVVGGTALLGGRGTVIGMIIGAALIEIIKNGLILGRAPGFYLQLFVGVTIVIAAIFNRYMERKAS
jgi:simple sugar transport system permease protein